MVAGVETVRRVYQKLDERVELTILMQDGSRVEAGETVIELSGSTRSISNRRAGGAQFHSAPFGNCDLDGSVR